MPPLIHLYSTYAYKFIIFHVYNFKCFQCYFEQKEIKWKNSACPTTFICNITTSDGLYWFSFFLSTVKIGETKNYDTKKKNEVTIYFSWIQYVGCRYYVKLKKIPLNTRKEQCVSSFVSFETKNVLLQNFKLCIHNMYCDFKCISKRLFFRFSYEWNNIFHLKITLKIKHFHFLVNCKQCIVCAYLLQLKVNRHNVKMHFKSTIEINSIAFSIRRRTVESHLKYLSYEPAILSKVLESSKHST